MYKSRAGTDPDRTRAKEWLQNTRIEGLQRTAFGLPLRFQYPQSDLDGTVVGRREPEEDRIDRRASPLWLKVSKVGDDRYAGVATLFKSRFLPPGERLHEAKGQGPPLRPPADYTLIEQFITEGFDAREVNYE